MRRGALVLSLLAVVMVLGALFLGQGPGLEAPAPATGAHGEPNDGPERSLESPDLTERRVEAGGGTKAPAAQESPGASDVAAMGTVPSFRLEGQVQLAEGGPLPPGVVVVVKVSRDDLESAVGEPLPVEPGGAFGPQFLPIRDGDAWTVVLFGGGIETLVQPIRSPRPDDSLFVSLLAAMGSEANLVVRDPEGDPISQAECSMIVEPGGAWTPLPATDPHGRTKLSGLPVQGDLTLSVRADGFEDVVLGAYVLPLAEEGLEVVLEPAGDLVLRVTDDRGAVEDFDLVYWRDSPSSPEYRTFRGAQDGTVTVEGVPLGVISALAYSRDRVQSRTEAVEVTSGGPNRIDLELRLPLVGLGRIVDGATGDPIPDATVEPYATAGDRYLSGWCEPVPVAQDGSFRVAAFAPGEARMIVEAPGYEFEMVSGSEDLRGEIDFGVVPLYRGRVLEVQLTSDDVVNFAGYYVATSWARDHPWTECTPSGLAEFPDSVSGTYEFLVHHPSGAVSRFSRTLRDGEEWRVVVEIVSGVEVVIEVRRDGDPVGEGFGVVALGADEGGRPLALHAETDPQGTATLGGVLGEVVVLEVYDRADRLVALNPLRLSDAPKQALRVDLDEEVYQLRVVDLGGVPVPGVEVRASCRETPGWSGWTDTNQDGIALLRAPARELVLKLVHDDHGQQSGVSLLLPEDRDEVAEVVFDPRGVVRARVIDGQSPVQGVKVWVRHPTDDTYQAPRRPDRSGVVEWRDVGAGSFELVGSAPGYFGIPTMVLSDSGSQDPTDIQLRRTGDLSIRVIGDVDGPLWIESLEGLGAVESWQDRGLVASSTSSMIPDGNGELLLTGLPQGRFSIRYGHLEETVVVPAGETRELELVTR